MNRRRALRRRKKMLHARDENFIEDTFFCKFCNWTGEIKECIFKQAGEAVDVYCPQCVEKINNVPPHIIEGFFEKFDELR